MTVIAEKLLLHQEKYGFPIVKVESTESGMAIMIV